MAWCRRGGQCNPCMQEWCIGGWVGVVRWWEGGCGKVVGGCGKVVGGWVGGCSRMDGGV